MSSIDFTSFLKLMAHKKASDLFITAGVPPSMKVNGKLSPITQNPLTPQQSRDLVLNVMSPAQREALLATHGEIFDPAWWQTGWFVLAMLLLIVALAFLLVRFSAVRYRRRALGLQVLVVAGIVWALKARPTTPRGLLKLGGLATPLVALPAYC